MIYRFDNTELDTDRFELRRSGVTCKVEPQVFALIELLVSAPERMITKEEINLRIWGGRIVSEAVVSSRIRSARQAIGDDGKEQRLIRTIHNRGFRFVGEVVAENPLLAAGPSSPEHPADTADTPGERPDTGRPSIAVLPFELLGHSERYGTLADALSHDIIVDLSRLHWMFVIARGSSFRFRGPNVDLNAAARVLGVRYLLTGSLAIHDRRTIVTVELSQGATGRVLWADRFEGNLDDLLGLRLTIASQIVSALEVRITAEEANRAASLPTANLDAWSAYHRGLWHMFRFTKHDNEIAARMFDRAVTTDAGFARAHAGLSFTHFQNAFIGYSADLEAQRAQALAHAERSVDLDPLDPFANLTMGRAMWIGGDLDASLHWYERAVTLSPNFAFAIYNHALADALCGRGAEAEADVGKAIALSPVDPLHYAMLATRALSHIVRGDYDAARTWGDRAGKAPNAHVHIRVISALANALAGDRSGAQHWVDQVRKAGTAFNKDAFFRSFAFRDPATLARTEKVLDEIGLRGTRN